MSITRLQQARQMYAMGQRVAKTLDGSRPGYRGSDYGDQTYSRGAYSNPQNNPGDQNSFNRETGTTSTNTGSQSNDDRSSDTQKYNHYEAISKNTGKDYNPLRPSGVGPGFIKPGDVDGLTLKPYEQKKLDFLDIPYQPQKIPPYIPFGTPLNILNSFLGKFGYEKNTQFFADNVAGKHGYEMTIDDYKRYMRDRGSGKVGAYGNENMGQNAINERSENRGGGGGGIMDVYDDNTTDDTTTDVDFVSRFLQNQPEDIRKAIEARMKNYYT